MVLSNELISQFAKLTTTEKSVKRETTIYGTVVEYNNTNYVRFDGSDLLTPVNTTVDMSPGERVTVLLKNHSATVTGNLSKPSAKNDTVNDVKQTVTGMESVMADVVRTNELEAESARIDTLVSSYLTVNETLNANAAHIKQLEAANTTITDTLNAANANIDNLQAGNVEVTNRLTAVEGIIKNLEVDNLDTETLRATYATIDFSNVGVANIGELYAKSGIIKDMVVSNSSVTGELVGVTISGDLIKANTLVADRLIIRGQNGLFYKLNTDGVSTESQQTDYNSINGKLIIAKSITATKVDVDDLVAFDATIGGFNLTENSIYSGVKNSVNANSPGIYLDDSGQVSFGDSANYVKYVKNTDGTYTLLIASDSLTASINNASKTATDYLNLSSVGLVVGQNPSNPTAGNTLISTDGVSIRKGTTVLAAFKADSRTATGITSANLTSTDSTDSESDGVTNVSGTVTSGETRANVYISTNGNPVYFPNGLETDKVLINDSSGIISNANIVLNGSLVDKSGEGVLTPLNSYGNMVIGYGRFQDGGATHVYGTRVKAKTKTGFSASVDGLTAIDTNNASGNATFGWHLYESNTGETNIYGKIVSLFAKDDIRINASGNNIRFDGDLVPYEGNVYNLGTPSLSIHDIYISCNDDNTDHGIKFSNTSGSALAVGINAEGYRIFGNTEYCTNIVTKSTTTTNTGYSFKVTCGDNPALTIEDNDARLLLYGGTDSTSRYLGSMAVYKRTYTNSANVVVTSNGMLGRYSSSSRRYKKDIVDLPIDTVRNLYDMPVRQYKYKADHISVEDERYETDIPGFIAEEVAEYFPIACDHIKDTEGNYVPEMWNSHVIVPALLKLIQDLNNRVYILENGGN